MTKVYVTLTDRSHYQELDLRKNKLSTKKNISFFKVNDEGEVEGHESTALYYGNDSIISTYKSVLKGNFKPNLNDNGFWNHYITKEKFDKFIKFSNKHGNVVILDETNSDSILSIIEGFSNELRELFNEKKELESTFKSLELKDKRGRWKKINYKNIIIFSTKRNSYESFIKISDRNTNITHAVNDTRFFDFKLVEENHNYYGFYHFGEPKVILKAGIKGTRKYLDICERITIKTKEISVYLSNHMKDLFK